MLKRIIWRLQDNEIKNLLNNFGFLILLSIANFVLPFLSFPYLVKTIGVEKFGLLAFSISIISYFVMLTDFSFNLSATREIALNIDNKKKIDEIVSSVYVIKIILMLVSFIVLGFFLIVIPKLNEYWFIHVFTFGTVVGQLLFPMWFFQGIEKMRTISILNIISKGFFTLCIFIFIKKPEDFYLVPIFSSMGLIIIGVTSIIILYKNYKIRFYIPKKEVLLYYLKDGRHLFLSNISITLYTSTITSLLGFFTNNTIVGYYSVAERIISALRGMISPISQTLFPYLNKKAVISKEKVLEINRKLLIFVTPFFILGSIMLIIFAENILKFLFNYSDPNTALVLRILAFIPTLIFLHTIFALFTMLVFKRNKYYSQIILSAGILNLILAFVLIPLYHHVGAAICVIFIELYILARYIYYTETNGLIIIFQK
jgi:PST family polysaccharide transporter